MFLLPTKEPSAKRPCLCVLTVTCRNPEHVWWAIHCRQISHRCSNSDGLGQKLSTRTPQRPGPSLGCPPHVLGLFILFWLSMSCRRGCFLFWCCLSMFFGGLVVCGIGDMYIWEPVVYFYTAWFYIHVVIFKYNIVKLGNSSLNAWFSSDPFGLQQIAMTYIRGKHCKIMPVYWME